MICSRRLILNIVAALLWSGAAQAEAQGFCHAQPYVPVAQRYYKGLLFKIEKDGGPASYIFGTVHLARKEIALTASDVFLLLPQIQAVGIEVSDAEQDMRAMARRAMTYPEGDNHRLSRDLAPDYYNRLKTILAKGNLDIAAFEHVRPWAVALTLVLVGEEQGMVLDEKIKAAAIGQGKPVFGLETMQEQMDIFSSLPEGAGMSLLKDAIDNNADSKKEKDEMLAAYLSKDARKVEALGEESLVSGSGKELEDLIRDKLITKRNRIMEQRMLPHMSGQSILIAIGAMHLMGKDGVLHLLEQDGYCITPMP